MSREVARLIEDLADTGGNGAIGSTTVVGGVAGGDGGIDLATAVGTGVVEAGVLGTVGIPRGVAAD